LKAAHYSLRLPLRAGVGSPTSRAVVDTVVIAVTWDCFGSSLIREAVNSNPRQPLDRAGNRGNPKVAVIVTIVV